ncbi:hypothetical protein BX666DRAFT_1838244, partial [Dichotomocladium elegans]
WVTGWLKTNMYFLSNRVFVNETAFHINMKALYAWLTKGTLANVTIPEKQGGH